MSSSAERLVSVILPVKNGEEFVAEALQSVRSQALPPGCSLEIIVIDDASSDATLDAVSAACPEAMVLHGPGQGPATARNLGLAQARGDIIGFIDHDDLWPEGKLVAQLKYFDEDSQLDVLVGLAQWLRMPGASMPDLRFTHANDSLHFVYLGAVLCRKAVFDRIGPFYELRLGEDQDFFLRSREAGLKIVKVEETGLIYRVHATNMTGTRPPGQLEHALTTCLRMSLQRRRQSGATGNLPAMLDFGPKG